MNVDFENQETLATLIMRNCSLVGRIPSFIGKLKNLKHLELTNYGKDVGSVTIPKNFWDLSNLEYLKLAVNVLLDSGSVREKTFGNFQKLEFLSLEFHSSPGIDFFTEVIGLKDLKMLSLSGITLSGHERFLEKVASSLNKLEALDVGYNKISGPIPEQIGNLVKLTSLDLSVSHLNGTIPTVMGMVTIQTDLTQTHSRTTQANGPIAMEMELVITQMGSPLMEVKIPTQMVTDLVIIQTVTIQMLFLTIH